MNLNPLLTILLFTFLQISCTERKDKDEKVFPTTSSEEIQMRFAYKNTDLNYNFTRKFSYRAIEVSRKDDFITIHNFQQNTSEEETRFWVANGYTQTIEQYNSDFQKVTELGSQGPGPEEFSQSHIVYIDQDRIFVHDFKQTAIKEVNISSGSIDHYKLNGYFYSSAFLPDNKVLFHYSKGNDPVKTYDFDLVDFKRGVTVEKIQIPVAEAEYISKVYEGDFRQNNSYAVYFNYSVGMLFVFDRKANKFARKITTIDKTPPPRAGFKEFGGGMKVLVNEPSNQMFKDGFLDKDNMFWLLNDIINEENSRVIDVYSLSELSGEEYKYSIKIPHLNDGQEAVKIFKVGNNLITYYNDQTIVNYEIRI